MVMLTLMETVSGVVVVVMMETGMMVVVVKIAADTGLYGRQQCSEGTVEQRWAAVLRSPFCR